MRVLVTGGCGFIGRAYIAHLLDEGAHSIRVLDNLSGAGREDLAELAGLADQDPAAGDWVARLALMVGDIRDRAAVGGAVAGADLVVHLAANTGVAPSVADPFMDGEVNVLGTLNLLEACRAEGVKQFVFASSGAPVGVQTPPLHEDMAPRPASPYGASKLAGEGYCSAYYHCFGVETVALRFGNVYGEGSGHKQSVVAKFIRAALAGETLEIFGDGGQTRDFIHISDLVAAIEAAATTGGVGGEIFQIATAAETTVSELTEQLLTVLERHGVARPPVRFGPVPAGDVARNFSDTSKARTRLGWQAEIGLDEGLERTVRYFLAHRQGQAA